MILVTLFLHHLPPCAPFTAPYAETFSTSSTPTCWTNTGGESWIFSTGAAYGAGSAGDNTGDGGNYAWVDGSTSNPPSSNLATLTFSVDISALSIPRLRYFTFQNNTNAPGDNATLYVIVNGTDTVDTYASDNAAWVERTVDLSSYSGVVSFAFKADHNGMTGSQFYADVLIDDVSLKKHQHVFQSAQQLLLLVEQQLTFLGLIQMEHLSGSIVWCFWLCCRFRN